MRTQVNVTTDDDLGTIYSVAVPVKRVKATARLGLNEDSMEVCCSWHARLRGSVVVCFWRPCVLIVMEQLNLTKFNTPGGLPWCNLALTRTSCSVQGLEAVEWDEEDPEADPSSRFPFGT